MKLSDADLTNMIQNAYDHIEMAETRSEESWNTSIVAALKELLAARKCVAALRTDWEGFTGVSNDIPKHEAMVEYDELMENLES